MRLGCGVGLGLDEGFPPISGAAASTLADDTLAATGIAIPAPAMLYRGDAAGVTKDGSNIVSQINDLSGNGKHLTQVTSGRRMLWVDNGSPNGTEDILRSTPDGTNAKFEQVAPGAAAFTTTGYTTFLVQKRTAGTGGVLFYHNNGAIRGGWHFSFSADNRFFQARTSGGTVKSATFGAYTNNTAEIWGTRNWGGGSDDVDSSTWFDTRVNGSTQTWSGTPWFWVPTSGWLTSMGIDAATSGPSADIAHAEAFASYFTAAQMQVKERALGALYGITVP